jgi:hypothetical protein
LSRILVHIELEITARLQKQQHIIALALVADTGEKKRAVTGISIYIVIVLTIHS